MRFEHLIQVNDPRLPLAPLTRQQLWRGLVRRAEQPAEFVLGLSGAVIHERHRDGEVVELIRTLDFGSFQVADRLRMVPMQETQTSTPAGSGWPASRMIIRIEEPEPAWLCLRFVYESDAEDGAEGMEAIAAALRNQAYKSADVDTVRRIRELAAKGELD
jgi:hypothetical protein